MALLLAYAWGNNTYGQLGDSTRTNESTPISVSSAILWQQIVCGASHVAAINGVGLAYAWGYNNSGQLGDNSVVSKSAPISVSSAISWKQIYSRANYTVAINGANGLAYAWGNNTYGQIGDNTTDNKSVPTSVSSTISWKQIACGLWHTAAINGANGLAYAWGNNSFGQLGDNSVTDISVPTSVSSTISWKQIACGYYHTAAIDGATGLAYAWGRNDSGHIGDNTTDIKSVPTSVSSTISWKQIACGGAHTVAINGANGLAYAWGDNTYGQIGDNTTDNKSVPTSVSSTISWKQIACGYFHTAANTGLYGAAYAWGYNNNGQLGDNSIVSKSVPTPVVSNKVYDSIICGDYFSVALEATGLLVFRYRTAATYAGIEGVVWSVCLGPFNSLGYAQIRVDCQ